MGGGCLICTQSCCSLTCTHAHIHHHALPPFRVAKEHLARVLELLDKNPKLVGVLIAQHGVGPLLFLLLEAKPQQNGGVAVAW